MRLIDLVDRSNTLKLQDFLKRRSIGRWVFALLCSALVRLLKSWVGTIK